MNLTINRSRQAIANRYLAKGYPGVVKDRYLADTAGPLGQVLIVSIGGNRLQVIILYRIGVSHAAQVYISGHDPIGQYPFWNDTIIMRRTAGIRIAYPTQFSITSEQGILHDACFGTVLIC